jgi:hypothetical protein
MEDFYRKMPAESLINVAKIIVQVATVIFLRNPTTFLCLRENYLVEVGRSGAVIR